MIASGEAAPRSMRALYAQLTAPWASSCPGVRHNKQYVTAGTSGGLAGPKREGPP